ncbi:hypothetical protein MML48_2g00006941 [Holotrichia oblita]|uniref:Uncharacterized protein n=1 Tax=Holotrichia oblita TaxID=644536 RepID=A0ACB9TJC1_HOLOL|nr:hypothetical protein MML48_2g00006941 [Holotrichia oblita]
MSKTFTYFAYGSNLLAKRLRLNNPSAIRNGIGKLEDYEIDFASFSPRWRGAIATITRKKGKVIWGSIWELDDDDMKTLDEQEGVAKGVYFGMDVDVITQDGNRKRCRLYKLNHKVQVVTNIEDLPEERRPSPAYLKVILLGAKESNLPEDYVEFLRKIPHNGYTGDIGIDLDVLEKGS